MAKSDTPKRQNNATDHGHGSKNSHSEANPPRRDSGHPTPPSEHSNSDDTENNPPFWKRGVFWHWVLQVALLIVGVRVAWIYSEQLKQMVESNKINRESLQAIQRAFVTAQAMESNRFANSLPDGSRWIFVKHFIDDGTTPAMQVMQRFDGKDLPNGLSEDEFIGSDYDIVSAKNNVGTIGPKEPHAIGPVLKSDSFVFSNKIVDPKARPAQPVIIQKEIFFYGWLVYRDVFPNTPIHLTEFCHVLQGITFDTKSQLYTLSFIDCGKHNCTDEYCEDYPQLLSKLAANGVSLPVTTPRY